MHYATTELDNDENEGEYSSISVIYDVAKCQKYMVRSGYYNEYYGLIDRDGNESLRLNTLLLKLLRKTCISASHKVSLLTEKVNW